MTTTVALSSDSREFLKRVNKVQHRYEQHRKKVEDKYQAAITNIIQTKNIILARLLLCEKQELHKLRNQLPIGSHLHSKAQRESSLPSQSADSQSSATPTDSLSSASDSLSVSHSLSESQASSRSHSLSESQASSRSQTPTQPPRQRTKEELRREFIEFIENSPAVTDKQATVDTTWDNVQLNKHIRQQICAKYSQIKNKKYRCNVCYHEYISVPAIELHVGQEHIDKKAYACEKCGKEFALSNHLEQHRKKHLLTNTCDICNKKFEGKRQLSQHKLQEHGNQKPFVCSKCCKRFNNHNSLNLHQCTHTNK